MINTFVSTALSASLLLGSPATGSSLMVESAVLADYHILASEVLDLSYRYPVEGISSGFRENILIALSYFNSSIILRSGEVFAFHKNVLPEFRSEKIITQESGFLAKDGYKTVAGLQGNGVCHLASLMNWVAQEAGLEVIAEVDHDFATIPGIDKKYGTSIYFLPGGGSTTERQNLYIKNTKDFPVEFRFVLEGNLLTFSIITI